MGLSIFNDAVPLLFRDKSVFLTTTVRELLFAGVYINCSYPEDSFPAGAVCQGLRMRAPRTYRRAGADFYFSMFNHVRALPYFLCRHFMKLLHEKLIIGHACYFVEGGTSFKNRGTRKTRKTHDSGLRNTRVISLSCFVKQLNKIYFIKKI